MSLLSRLNTPGPKRLLALDGGGIRGAITLGYLVELEKILRERYRKPDFRLCDYFDLIGGTSTGAIIASGLAIGMSAVEISELYQVLGGRIFGQKKGLFQRLSAKFKIDALESELTKIFGDMTLASERIRTGLCIVTKRADTGSTWPLTNHPEAKYFKYNKDILLREAVRASTAAPTYFEPEAIEVGKGQVGAFVDGGVSMHNDPSMMLFLMATLRGFPYHWSTGADQLLLTSIGTGTWPQESTVADVTDNKLWDWAGDVINLLMNDAKEMHHLLLQYLSQSPTAKPIDREIGDLSQDLLGGRAALHYLRYDAVLTQEALSKIGFGHVDATSLHEMSAAENRGVLAEIGAAAAQVDLQSDHFPAVFDPA
ncbi:MAG: patatin-like phospholipase family protein [Bacteroidota bacterium]